VIEELKEKKIKKKKQNNQNPNLCYKNADYQNYSEDEQELNIPELEKIHIQDLYAFSLSSWDIETAVPNKGSGLSFFLIDTAFIYLLALPAR